MSCRQEECPNWSGDGNVCPCALFDLGTDAVDQAHGVDDDFELPGSY